MESPAVAFYVPFIRFLVNYFVPSCQGKKNREVNLHISCEILPFGEIAWQFGLLPLVIVETE